MDFEDALESPMLASSLLGATPTFLKPPNFVWMKRGGGASSPVDADELDKAMELLDTVFEGDFAVMAGGLPLPLPFALARGGWEDIPLIESPL